MNIVMQAFVDRVPMSKAMHDSNSLALIERICEVFEAAQTEDAELAAEVMRVIRAVAVGGQVTILSGGPAERLLRSELSQDPFLWTIVSVEDDSVPDSAT